MNYRLLDGAEGDVDRILLRSARTWGFEAAGRYDRLMRTVFAAIAALPALHGSQEIAGHRFDRLAIADPAFAKAA